MPRSSSAESTNKKTRSWSATARSPRGGSRRKIERPSCIPWRRCATPTDCPWIERRGAKTMKKVERNELLGLAEYEQIRQRFMARVIAEKRERRVIAGDEVSIV